jgi:hypothetical protein
MTDSKIKSAKKLLASGVPPRDVAGNLGVSVPNLSLWQNDEAFLRLLGQLPLRLSVAEKFGSHRSRIQASAPRPCKGRISLAEPQLNVTEHRTVTRFALIPAIWLLCLVDDLRDGRSQYSGLGWYCAITTVCPIHRNPMVSCCPTRLCLPSHASPRESRNEGSARSCAYL